MSETKSVFDDVDYHTHACDNCGEEYHCCCPDEDENSHAPLCTDCYEAFNEEG